MSDKLKQLVSSRANYRGQVNQIHNDIDNFGIKTAQERDTISSKLKRLQTELGRLDQTIQDLKWENNKSDEQKAIRENDQEIGECSAYGDKLSEGSFALSQVSSVASTSSTGHSSSLPLSLLKSATAPLPKYTSTEGEDLVKFFAQFEETTKRFNYTDYDKFLLLKERISGRASALICSLDVVQHSYQIAKQLLLEALASPTVQKFNVIKQMASLKLDYLTEPFEYIGKINSVHRSFEDLKITTDDILQYFAWIGLNESFKTHLVHITNEAKPSLKQIKAKFYEANERYLSSQQQYKTKQRDKDKRVSNENSAKATCLAADVKFKQTCNVFKICPLCKENGKFSPHPLSKCPKYPDPKSKVEKLQAIKACTKCARLDHVNETCRFHFFKRCECGKWHLSFLCLEEKESKGRKESEIGKESGSKNTKPGKINVKETVSGVSVTEEFTNNFKIADCSRSILPTFSCHQNGRPMRCMRDSGCQSNFILESRANRDKLPVVDSNVQLRVNGFNSSQVYTTSTYKFEILIGNEAYEVEAIGIPSIRTSLTLPGLNTIVKGFIDKGYALADEFLLQDKDEIGNIEFILGSSFAYCLMETSITFGGEVDERPSVYSHTPAGIMLLGNIDEIKVNLKHLPFYHNVSLAQSSKAEESPGNDISVTYRDLGLHKTLALESVVLNDDPGETKVNLVILDDQGKVVNSELQKATDEMLDKYCCSTLNYDKDKFSDDVLENEKIVNHVLNNTTRNDQGRLVMPLIWNHKVDHLLGKNRHLATQILKSNYKKLSKNLEHLKMVDQSFAEQRELGIIERIENLDTFLEEHPSHSFLAHMAVFKPERDTTKCRVVYLSNLCERIPSQAVTLNHNQAMLSGPSLNQKITTALLHLRFDLELLCFDIKKAFLNIDLSDLDSNKLLFLWFNNISKGDFSIVAYRSLRLPFGLVCSPCLLLLGLYKILMMDTCEDSDQMKELKKLIYSLIYMDNCSVTANDSGYLKWAFESLNGIFEPYKFSLQQFATNNGEIQANFDKNLTEPTPETVKLLGLFWNRKQDFLSTRALHLDSKADTKRLVLKTIATHYDVFGFTLPILNRARLFLHKLQCDSSLKWDSKLSSDRLREWKNITKQVNSSPSVEVKRFVGKRDGNFRLVAFTDSTKEIYGTVIFIQDLDSLEVSFLLAKNRMINKQLSSKSIPSLEFQGITLGTEVLIETYQELSGPTCVNPVKIKELQLFSDSMVSLAWINSYSHKMDKVNKHSVFIRNRLEHLNNLCAIHPVKYGFVSGIENPADQVTRPVSHRVLMKSNFFSGPKLLKEPRTSCSSREDIFDIVVPNPMAKSNAAVPDSFSQVFVSEASCAEPEHLVLMDKCSSFAKLVNIHKYVFSFIHKLKVGLLKKYPEKYSRWKSLGSNFHEQAITHIIKTEQHIYFKEVFSYFESGCNTVNAIPNLVNQLNVYPDKNGLLRVKSKFSRWKDDISLRFPVLLPKTSILTKLIVFDLHRKLSHAGCYRLLAELRKEFWITHCFSVVKSIIKGCIICRKTHQRTIKLNQSPYKDFRLTPPNIPFRTIFIDHFGPYHVKYGEKKIKVWVLCITCLWSRAVNLEICCDLSTKEFLRALQFHCFKFGLPNLCLSDLGSSLVAGANIIRDFLKDVETQSYLEENGVKTVTFEQYFKGCHPLGGIVEICVKMVRKMINCSIKNYVLEYRDFEFIVVQTVHLINRRPIAFQEGLRDTSDDIVPDAITPEKLIHGYDLISVNIIPELQPDPEYDPDWQHNIDHIDNIKENYHKLKKARKCLIDTYTSEFLGTLMKQAVNKESRYKPVSHQKLSKGDIVLIKEENCKPMNFPMAIVKEVKTNVINEVTDAILLKGKTREIVKRHVTSLIPILCEGDRSAYSNTNEAESNSSSPDVPNNDTDSQKFQDDVKQKRKAAVDSREKTRKMLADS